MATIPSANYSHNVQASAVSKFAPAVSGNVVAYNATKWQTLFVENASASPITVTLKGADAPSDFLCPGTGQTEDLTGGAVIAVAAGAVQAIPLQAFRAMLQGAVTLDVSAVADVSCWLVED